MLFVTETWLNDGVYNGLLDPRSMYHVLRRDRRSCGGGVAAFVNRQLHKIIEVPVAAEYSNLELLCFDVVFKAHKVRFFHRVKMLPQMSILIL